MGAAGAGGAAGQEGGVGLRPGFAPISSFPPRSPQAAALRSPPEPAELRPAALLRFGRGPGGSETPTPRLVALELKGTAGPGRGGSGGPATTGRPRRHRAVFTGGVGSLRPDGAGTEPPVTW